MSESQPTTNSQEYFEYLEQNQRSKVSYVLQTPYRVHLKSLRLGRTLDVGCGAGRNLRHLSPDSVGVDHNAALVAYCVSRGMHAFTNDDLQSQPDQLGAFDSILYSHLIEHLSWEQAEQMLADTVPYLKAGGRVVAICPQEVGYASDPTHVVFFDTDDLERLFERAGLRVYRSYSFPFPRAAGRRFKQNETVVIGVKPTG